MRGSCVHPLGDARPKQYFPHHDEKRDSHQEKIDTVFPDHVTHHDVEGKPRVHQVDQERETAKHDGYWQRKRN